MSGEYKKFIREKVAASKGITFFQRPIEKCNRRELIAAIVCLSDEKRRKEESDAFRALLRRG